MSEPRLPSSAEEVQEAVERMATAFRAFATALQPVVTALQQVRCSLAEMFSRFLESEEGQALLRAVREAEKNAEPEQELTLDELRAACGDGAMLAPARFTAEGGLDPDCGESFLGADDVIRRCTRPKGHDGYHRA